MDDRLPRGDWYETDSFRELVKQATSLRPGGWSLAEFEHAVSEMGWELKEPQQIVDQVWRRFVPRKGPWGGYATAISDASAPERVRRLNVRVVDMPAEHLPTDAGHVRAAWWIMEDELGPPTLWGGDGGPWMLWRRPGTSFLVHSHDGGEVSLELLHTDSDPDAAGRSDSRGSWRAAAPADLLPVPAAPFRPAADWDEVQKRLFDVLRDLDHDTVFLPGRFILHLTSVRDPLRFVQCWNQDRDLALVVEATGYTHHPELADPDRLARSGWKLTHSLWKGRFPHNRDESEHLRTAARMLVEELQHLGVDLADLAYGGTVTGRGHGFHLDLPALGLPRVNPDA
ncbi:TY-Chap domain-containing protein [Streptomyces sp. NPDC087897]|uniref:TY-Chap domain-containing protein n=1 Tax=Streptomyces sp. NPDC087897 TaxID=3365817 RepID=UPI00382FBC80